MLSREAIQSAQDVKTERVDVPEWAPAGSPKEDAFVMVRGLSAEERDSYEQACLDVKRRGRKVDVNMAPNPRARLVALSVVDSTGNRMFTDNDVAWLGRKSAPPIDRIYDVAQRLSGISVQDAEELEKNSVSTQPVLSA